MCAENYGVMLVKTASNGYITSGSPIPTELYTPKVIAAWIKNVQEMYSPVTDEPFIVDQTEYMLMDESDVSEHFFGNQQALSEWYYCGTVTPYGIEDRAPVTALLIKMEVAQALNRETAA